MNDKQVFVFGFVEDNDHSCKAFFCRIDMGLSDKLRVIR